MSQAPDPKRWIADDADVPAELTRLLRAGRDELGTTDELAELARRLSAELGPASGLAVRAPLEAAAPAGAMAGARAFAGLGAGARIGAWLVAGAGAVAVVWVVASGLSGGRDPSPPASPPDEGTLPREVATIPSTPGIPLAPAPDRAAPDAAPPAPALDSTAAAAEKPTRAAARGSRGSRASRPAPLLEEAALLEQAQAALAGDPAVALALTRRHQRQFPRGALGQEREVIAIEALKRLGRHEAANSRAAAFERRYRRSVHRPRLERTTDTSSPADHGINTDP